MNNNPTNHDNEKHKAVDWKTKSSEIHSTTFKAQSSRGSQSNRSHFQEQNPTIIHPHQKHTRQPSPSYSLSGNIAGKKTGYKVKPVPVIVAIMLLLAFAFIIKRCSSKDNPSSENSTISTQSDKQQQYSTTDTTNSQQTENDQFTNSNLENNNTKQTTVSQYAEIDENYKNEISLHEGAEMYSGHYYKVFNISLSWSEAEDYCKGIGGHLASINSWEEQTFLLQLTANSSKNNIWIGGFWNGSSWEWSDGTDFIFTNWDHYVGDDGEEYIKPDNYWGDEYYIRYANADLTFDSWIANKGKWDDTADEADGYEGDAPISSFGFICEWNS